MQTPVNNISLRINTSYKDFAMKFLVPSPGVYVKCDVNYLRIAAQYHFLKMEEMHPYNMNC